ncbi:MAG: hypothetical protein JSR90_18200 [Proteobacteria bacterium]|nr:hypothetical protein [Pseudomonadota bacterium]
MSKAACLVQQCDSPNHRLWGLAAAEHLQGSPIRKPPPYRPAPRRRHREPWLTRLKARPSTGSGAGSSRGADRAAKLIYDTVRLCIAVTKPSSCRSLSPLPSGGHIAGFACCGLKKAGLARFVVGVGIAGIVLLPEGIASVRAALLNRLQNSINLVLGLALASIGLTIPVVAVVSLVLGRSLTLGLALQNMVLLVLTLFVGTLTLGTGRTTLLRGVIHLAIFGAFLLLAIVP